MTEDQYTQLNLCYICIVGTSALLELFYCLLYYMVSTLVQIYIYDSMNSKLEYLGHVICNWMKQTIILANNNSY
jgi:hypothetical protein